MTQDIAWLCERLRKSADACDAPSGDKLREVADALERLQGEVEAESATATAFEALWAASQDRVAKLEEVLEKLKDKQS